MNLFCRLIPSLFAGIICFAASVQNVDAEVISKSELANVLPTGYATSFEYSGGKGYAFVCAEPDTAPTINGPWAQVFLVTSKEAAPAVEWRKTLTNEPMCSSIEVFGRGSGCALAVVETHELHGSISVDHLRAYQYNEQDDSPVERLSVSCVDGGFLRLSERSDSWPAIMVYEPQYGSGGKLAPRTYRLRLYIPNGRGFKLKTRLTAESYPTASDVHQNIEGWIRDVLGERYVVPKSL